MKDFGQLKIYHVLSLLSLANVVSFVCGSCFVCTLTH